MECVVNTKNEELIHTSKFMDSLYRREAKTGDCDGFDKYPDNIKKQPMYDVIKDYKLK